MATIPMYIPIDGFLYIIIYLVLLPFFLKYKKEVDELYHICIYNYECIYTSHFYDYYLSSPTKKMKNPPPRFICCKCRKQQPFSAILV